MSDLTLELDTTRIVETRNITLPQGGTLEVTMTQEFIDKLRQHFGLFGDQPIEDDQIRMFVWGAFNGAIDKAENQPPTYPTGTPPDAEPGEIAA